MKEKIIGIILIIATVLTYVCPTISQAASNKSQLNNEKKQLDNKIAETKENLNEVENNKSKALKDIEKLTAEITEYEDQLDDLNSQISKLNKSIAEETENLKKATSDYENQQKLLQERLVMLYEEGETSYLDVLLNAESFSDFISNYYLISEITSADTEMLQKIEDQKKNIEQAKKELEENKSKIVSVKKDKQQKADKLSDAKKNKNTQVSKLSAQEKELQNDLDAFEADKKAIKNKLAAIAKQEEEERKNNAGGSRPPVITGKPSASGYIFPVAGLSKANIRNKSYPSYPGHSGTDVNINVTGKTIVAVKAGTVITSEAKIKNGRYYSYGEYIIINHHDGTMTLYAHGLPGSRRVREGQKVSQGQAIMTVGNTGNSTGTHLHFEVRVGGSPVNPLPYLP